MLLVGWGRQCVLGTAGPRRYIFDVGFRGEPPFGDSSGWSLWIGRRGERFTSLTSSPWSCCRAACLVGSAVAADVTSGSVCWWVPSGALIGRGGYFRRPLHRWTLLFPIPWREDSWSLYCTLGGLEFSGPMTGCGLFFVFSAKLCYILYIFM